MAELLAVGLIALEVVDGGADLVPGFLIGKTAWTLWPTIWRAWKGTMTS